MARPRKDPASIKLRNVVFRASDDDRACYKRRAAEAGLSRSDYLRQVGRKGRIVIRKTQEIDPALLAELNRIGVNLNQIAYKANATGRFDATEIEATRQKLEAFLLKAMETLDHGPDHR